MKRIGFTLLAILLVAFPLFSQVVNIPDANFLAALIEGGVDTNEDGLISNEEAETATELHLWYREISDLTGIEAFTFLKKLYCEGNQLTSLDVSHNTALVALGIAEMPTLYEVCVWEIPFPPSGVDIYTTGSHNVEFKDCSGATGIEKSGLTELSIYPNPTNNLLTIETEQPNHYSIEITSLNGQLIRNTEMEGTTHQIDLSSFQKGVYLITIRSEDYVTTKKIVKL